MKWQRFFLLCLLSVWSALADTDDVRYIDQLIEHNNQSVALADLAQEKGQDLELKRFMRKLKRDDNREIRRLNQWRQGYYSDEPLSLDWQPAQNLDDLEVTEGKAFDLQLIDHMLIQIQRGEELMKETENKSRRAFLRRFAEKNLEAYKEEAETLIALKKRLSLEE